MKRLQIKRRIATNRRRMRRDLVHAAGCVFSDCCVRSAAFDSFGIVNEALLIDIRVPRALLGHWLRVFGGNVAHAPHAEHSDRVLAKLRAMTPEELRRTFVDAGIFDESGNLTEPYRG